MQREVKFRFWDKTSQAWLKEDAVTVDGNGKVFLFGEHFPIYENIVIVQFTGLKDKNGKEIYEGDIMTLWKERINLIEWEEYDDEPPFVGFRINDHIAKKNEVIGNIYENPELLQNK